MQHSWARERPKQAPGPWRVGRKLAPLTPPPRATPQEEADPGSNHIKFDLLFLGSGGLPHIPRRDNYEDRKVRTPRALGDNGAADGKRGTRAPCSDRQATPPLVLSSPTPSFSTWP